MKKLFNIILALSIGISAFAIEHTYTKESVLNTGHWVKIRVSESGVYQLTYDELKDMGLNPADVRIYGYGGAIISQDFELEKIDDLPAVRFYMDKGDDGVFGKGDYILFYGQGSISWSWDTNAARFLRTRNPYSDYGYYFLSDDAGEQLLMNPSTAEAPSTSLTVTTYQARLLHESELVNLLDPINGEDGGGRNFYGEHLSSQNNSLSFNFDFQNIVSGSKVKYGAYLAAKGNTQSTMTVTASGKKSNATIDMIKPEDHYTKAKLKNIQTDFTADGTGTQSVTVQFSNSGGNADGYIDYIEMMAECQLTMVNDAMPLRTNKGYKNNSVLAYRLDNANAGTQIWNITNLEAIECEPTRWEGNQLVFYGNNQTVIQEYIAVNTRGANWLKPMVMGQIGNQNLHAQHNIDMVIITPAAFVGPAQDLAAAHEAHDGITTLIVTDEQVYNEFSSGTPDASAYRWLMKMLYDRGNATDNELAPRWLLLLGDGTFDNRKLLPTSHNPSADCHYLLTYQAENSTVETQAYVTDDYFTFMRNQDGLIDAKSVMGVSVGRLPARTVDEAANMVNKTIEYMNNKYFGRWKQQLVFLADDGDNGLHILTAEKGAEIVRTNNPDFIVNKIYLDAYPQEIDASGESYPLAKNRLDNLLREGVLYMNYSGHGGYNNISSEGMLGLNEIKKMTNKNLGFWMLATCNFSHFDSKLRCAAEEAVLNVAGGAIGVLSATRTVYANQNETINRHFCDLLFGHTDVYSYNTTVGEATQQAKNRITTNDINKLSYVLLGDPAVRLNYPTDVQVKTSSQMDTVNALTVHNVQGYIEEKNLIKQTDEEGNERQVEVMDTATWFNGKLAITIYDKMQRLSTRDNDEKDPASQKLYYYNDYPSMIFRGETDVINGRFQYSFMTPKDIRYNYGNGRIVYYAYDDLAHVEGVGHYEDFIIGGSSNSIILDDKGPDIKLYMNNPAFQSGDKTYETPRFFAEIFDENGINTAGSGIGHDLILTIDEDPKQSYVVNDYYTNNYNSYTGGIVSYLLPAQTEGMHKLSFRAWDLLNNSSTAELSYNVVKGMDPNIFSVTSYVLDNIMYITVQFDQPDQVLETEVYLYNAQGQLVMSHQQHGVDNIQLPLSRAGIQPGVYIYNVKIKSESSNYASRAGKIIMK